MKILVIDDKKFNLEIAKAQLADHEVITAENYDDGKALVEKNPDLDVVLVDLLMPASAENQPSESLFIGQEMPVGIFIALLAAKNGVKYVAVFTDVSHHGHPASACLDALNIDEENPTAFRVGEAKFFLCNNRSWFNRMMPEAEKKAAELYKKYRDRHKELQGHTGGDEQATKFFKEYQEYCYSQPKGKGWNYLLKYMLKY